MVSYLFLEESYGLWIDKEDLLDAQVIACEKLLKYTKEPAETLAVQKEIDELRMTRDLMAWGEDAINAADLTPVYARKVDTRKATFVICQDCFCGGSCFRAVDNFRNCPVCRKDSIDALLILGGEYYKAELSRNGNVELSFAPAHKAYKL